MTWKEFVGDPARTALALRAAQATLGSDGIVNWFDTYAEAESLGLVPGRDSKGFVPGVKRLPGDPADEAERLAADLLPRLREITARLAKERGGETMLMACATGPRTLVARLWGACLATPTIPDPSHEARRNRAAVEQAAQWLVRMVRAYCEAGADLLLLAEEEAETLGEFYQAWGPLVEQVFSLAKYYNRPCLVLARRALAPGQLAAAKQGGLVSPTEAPAHVLLGIGTRLEPVHVIPAESFTLPDEKWKQTVESLRANLSPGLYFSSWEIAADAEPERLVRLGRGFREGDWEA